MAHLLPARGARLLKETHWLRHNCEDPEPGVGEFAAGALGFTGSLPALSGRRWAQRILREGAAGFRDVVTFLSPPMNICCQPLERTSALCEWGAAFHMQTYFSSLEILEPMGDLAQLSPAGRRNFRDCMTLCPCSLFGGACCGSRREIPSLGN